MIPNPIGQLLALPLQAAVRAQVLSHLETLSAIEEIGIDNGRAKVFRLKAERTIEERVVDPATGIGEIKPKIEPFEISIPLLAMLPIQTIKLQEMEVDFGLDVLELRSAPLTKLGTASLAASPAVFSDTAHPNRTAIKFHMKIAQQTSEGIARVGDVLTDALGGRPLTISVVDDIPRITQAVASGLKDKGLGTISDFLDATATDAARAALAKSLGITINQLEAFVAAAKRLT